MNAEALFARPDVPWDSGANVLGTHCENAGFQPARTPRQFFPRTFQAVNPHVPGMHRQRDAMQPAQFAWSCRARRDPGVRCLIDQRVTGGRDPHIASPRTIPAPPFARGSMLWRTWDPREARAPGERKRTVGAFHRIASRLVPRGRLPASTDESSSGPPRRERPQHRRERRRDQRDDVLLPLGAREEVVGTAPARHDRCAGRDAREEPAARSALPGAVTRLPKKDLARFREWFAEYDAAVWDLPIKEDATGGKTGAQRQQTGRPRSAARH